MAAAKPSSSNRQRSRGVENLAGLLPQTFILYGKRRGSSPGCNTFGEKYLPSVGGSVTGIVVAVGSSVEVGMSVEAGMSVAVVGGSVVGAVVGVVSPSPYLKREYESNPPGYRKTGMGRRGEDEQNRRAPVTAD